MEVPLGAALAGAAGVGAGGGLVPAEGAVPAESAAPPPVVHHPPIPGGSATGHGGWLLCGFLRLVLVFVG